MINADYLASDSQNLWDEKIKNILKRETKSDIQKILDLISITIYGNKNDDLSKLYKEIGLINFSKIVNIFSNRTIKIPDRENLQDMIMTALCFYYKELRGMSWDEIKNIFNFKEFSSIKYGKNIAKLKSIMGDNFKTQFYDEFIKKEI